MGGWNVGGEWADAMVEGGGWRGWLDAISGRRAGGKGVSKREAVRVQLVTMGGMIQSGSIGVVGASQCERCDGHADR